MTATHRRTVMERREQEHRRKEFHREDIIKQLKNDSIISGICSSDERVENIRRLRGQKERQEELQTHQALLHEAHEQAREAELIHREEEIVQKLQQVKTEKFRDEKLRQSIRENSMELRDLEQKLNYAYMNKERALQIHEKELLLKQEKLKEAERVAEMNKLFEKLNQNELGKEKQAHERSIQYHKALADQLADHEVRKQQEYEQFLREKAMVDEIVRKISAEDEHAALKRLEKQKETKKYIEDFVSETKRWRELEIQRKKEENERIEAYAKMLLNRENEIKAQKANAAEEKEHIYSKLAEDMANLEKEKEELEALRIELHQQEQEDAARKRDQFLLEERIRKRFELIDAYQKQSENKIRLLQKAKEDEDQFRAKLLQKFAEDERLEQMSQQKRRLKKIEHKKAIEALIEERRKLIKKEAEEHKLELERQQEVEKYRQAVIEQERQRLLREHAAGLIGFLPKGVIRDQKDLDLFDEEFKKKFGSVEDKKDL